MFSATDFSSQGKGIKRLILQSLSQFHASWSAQVQDHSFGTSMLIIADIESNVLNLKNPSRAVYRIPQSAGTAETRYTSPLPQVPSAPGRHQRAVKALANGKGST